MPKRPALPYKTPVDQTCSIVDYCITQVTIETRKEYLDAMNPPPVELAADYYLTNFVSLLNHVIRFYQDLLTPQELRFFHQFQNLDSMAQCLYVRMLMRTGDHFRREKLHYKEIQNIDTSLQALNVVRFIELSRTLPIEKLFPLFTKLEWMAFLKRKNPKLNVLKSLSREALWQLLIEHIPGEFSVDQPVVTLLQTEHFAVFQLLYFGNLHQDLSEFVISDLGLKRYPDYLLNFSTRRFQNREEIDTYLEVARSCDEIQNLTDLNPSQLLDHYHSLIKYTHKNGQHRNKIEKMLFKIARQIERLDAGSALPLYASLHCDQSFERRIRILTNQGDYQNAYNLCQKRKDRRLHAELKLFIDTFERKLAYKIGENVAPQKRLEKPETVYLYKTSANVEQIAAQHLSHLGKAIFVQNELFTCLFSIVYWQAIYADIAGAFSHPYQHQPHDLYTNEFRIKRTEIIDKLDKKYFDESYTWPTEEQFTRINSFHSAFGPWPNLSLNTVIQAVDIIPKIHLKTIFSRMWSDLKFCRSGFPDLIYFKPDRTYELIEIKGPGDTLQRNQTLWLRFFLQHQIPARVLRVEWI